MYGRQLSLDSEADMGETTVVDASGATATEAPTTEIVKFDGVIESAFGKKVADYNKGMSSIPYETTFEQINLFSAIPARELPTEADQLALVNNARKANARQKEIARVLDVAGIKKPTMEEDVELQVKSIVAGMIASKKYTEAQASELARRMLGLS